MEKREHLTVVDIGHHHLGPLLGKQASCLCSDALPTACNDGHLPGQKALGVVEVAGELRYAVRHGGVSGWFKRSGETIQVQFQLTRDNKGPRDYAWATLYLGMPRSTPPTPRLPFAVSKDWGQSGVIDARERSDHTAVNISSASFT